ncbi:MAG TPA: ParB/RepB/Spo0J family partition protein [Bryobacteraceae bacterium]|nr:ParB/RepB/Spo0J family partition protein [Bryobacteraceae bacterium]
MNDITYIPLNKLAISGDNVRKTAAAAEGIAELAASIKAHGLQQNLVVKKNGGKKFGIVDGGRRFQALVQLADAGTISGNYPVPCRVDESTIDGKELSLITNTMREDMHPADEFEAFKALVDAGNSTAEIAARRGCPESHVVKLLKLANCSPVLLKAYRDEKLEIEHLMAFAVTDDHKAQEDVFEQAPTGHPNYIRRLLTANEIPASDRRVRYIGVKAYEENGGPVKRDLFSDEVNGTFIVDAALLEKLATEKLMRAARAVQKEGWKWVDVVVSPFGYDQKAQFRQIHAEPPALPAKLAKEVEKLQAEYDEICDTDEEADIKRCDKIDARLQAIEKQRGKAVFTAEQLAIAGAVVTIGDDGKTEIVRGLVRPEDMPKGKGKSKAKAKASDTSDEDQDEARSELAAGLVEDLTAQKSAAISAVLLKEPSVALAAVVYALAVDIFGVSETCLQITASQEYFRKVEGSKALAQISAAKEKWSEKLPGEPENLWQWCLKQKADVLVDLLACCAALTVRAICSKQDKADSSRLQHADQLAKALELDMKEWFTPTAENYFNRVGKQQILAAVAEAKGQPHAPALEKLKKGELASQAERLVDGTGWLPALLRLPS